MLSLRKPSGEIIRQFLTAQAKLDFSYSAVGATATTPPVEYVVDHTRTKLGEGEPVFTAAKTALGPRRSVRHSRRSFYGHTCE
jgi:uncharacterized protein (UPF0548 family)